MKDREVYADSAGNPTNINVECWNTHNKRYRDSIWTNAEAIPCVHYEKVIIYFG